MGRALEGTGTVAPISSMETKPCPFEEMSPISGYLPSNARRCSKGKAWSREDEMAVPSTTRSVSTLRIRFLALVVFSAAVLESTFSVERSQSINGHQIQKRNFGRQSSIVCERQVKKLRTKRLLKKSRSSLSQRAAEHQTLWVKKQSL